MMDGLKIPCHFTFAAFDKFLCFLSRKVNMDNLEKYINEVTKIPLILGIEMAA